MQSNLFDNLELYFTLSEEDRERLKTTYPILTHLEKLHGLMRKAGASYRAWDEATRERLRADDPTLADMAERQAILAATGEERERLETVRRVRTELERNKEFSSRVSYMKTLLKRIGVSANIEDYDTFSLELRAAVLHAGMPPEDIPEATPRAICAILEHKVREIERLQVMSQGIAEQPAIDQAEAESSTTEIMRLMDELGWSVNGTAAAAHVSRDTVIRARKGTTSDEYTAKVLKALRLARDTKQSQK